MITDLTEQQADCIILLSGDIFSESQDENTELTRRIKAHEKRQEVCSQLTNVLMHQREKFSIELTKEQTLLIYHESEVCYDALQRKNEELTAQIQKNTDRAELYMSLIKLTMNILDNGD